jgi:hypothetical protein
MMSPLQKLIVLVIVLLGGEISHGASWNVRGYIYAGGIYYDGSHCVGSPPFQFGFREYHYSTDVAGYTIMYSEVARKSQPGDTLHMCTDLYLGPISFSVPMRPWACAVTSGVILVFVLTLADFALRFLRRKRYETRVA